MRFSTGLPNCREGRQNLIGSVNRDALVRQAVVAEECGYYCLWPNEFFTTRPEVARKYSQPPTMFDTLISMAYAAAATRRIRILPSTLVLPLHETIHLARQLATLDVFSEGRISVGIGLGGDRDEFKRLRPDAPNRSRLMDEMVQAMRLLWTERSASFQGEFVRFDAIETYPKPIQDPLPIFRAGHGEEVFKWIARHGQGWIDSSQKPEDAAQYVARLKTLTTAAGRDADAIEVVRQWYVAIADTEEEANTIYAASLPPGNTQTGTSREPERSGPGFGARPDWEQSLVGTPAQILQRMRDYAPLGLTEICAIFYSANVESMERQTRLFASEIMAHWD
jgi:probable F420-dependent oxidoreductase